MVTQGGGATVNGTVNVTSGIINAQGNVVVGANLTVINTINTSFINISSDVNVANTVNIANNLNVSNTATVNNLSVTGAVGFGTINATQFGIGNSTANLYANSVTVLLANSTQIISLVPGSLTTNTAVISTVVSIGNSTVNSVINSSSITTANVITSNKLTIGANVLVNTSSVLIGNSTVNSVINSSSITTTLASFGNTVVAGTLNVTSNVVLGANVSLTPTNLIIGNSTVNSVINSSAISGNVIATLGNTTINGFINVSANIVIGNVSLTPTNVIVGNSTIFTSINATTISGNSIASLGNTTINGFINVTSTANVVGLNSTGNNTLGGTNTVINSNTFHTAPADFGNNNVAGMRIKNYKEAVTVNTSITANAYTIDLSNTNIFDLTIANNITITLSNAPAAGNSYAFTVWVRQDATGGRAITWPLTVKWPNGSVPTLSTGASAIDILNFMTVDGGTTYAGGLALANLN